MPRWLLILSLIILGLGLLTYWLISAKRTPSPSQTTPTSVNPALDTSHWQTYSNPEAGFTLRYPSNLIADQSAAHNATNVVAMLSSSVAPKINISVFTTITDLANYWNSFGSGLAEVKTLTDFLTKAKNQGQVGSTKKIGGVVATELHGGPFGAKNYGLVFEHNQRFFLAQLVYENQPTNEENQVLSTFQFTK